MAELWERQEWESDIAFRAFHDYYLPMEQPRSVDAAYRKFMAEKAKKRESEHPESLSGVRKPPKCASGRWRYWSQGRSSSGPIPGAVDWLHRAEAWDKHVTDLEREKWEKRIIEQREADWKASNELRDKAIDLLSTVFEGDLSQVSRALEVSAKVGRLATGEPTERVEVNDSGHLSDDERIARLTAILDAARARRTGQAADGQSDLESADG